MIHSSDGGEALFENMENQAIALLSMKDKTGKKEAIYAGVSQAKTPYVLCWDADITFSEGYFKELSTLRNIHLLFFQSPMRVNGFLNGSLK